MEGQGGWRYGRHRRSIAAVGSTGMEAIKCEGGFTPRWLHRTAGGAEGHLWGGSAAGGVSGEGAEKPKWTKRSKLGSLNPATSQGGIANTRSCPQPAERPLSARQPPAAVTGDGSTARTAAEPGPPCVEGNGRADSHVRLVVPGERRGWCTWAAAPSWVPRWQNRLRSASPLCRGGWPGSPGLPCLPPTPHRPAALRSAAKTGVCQNRARTART